MSRIALTLAGLLALSSCSPGADLPLTDQGIAAFHNALNAGQFAQIYDSSANELKTTTTPEKFTTFLSAVHRKLGNFESGSRAGWNDTVNTAGHYVTINYTAKYQRGDAVEEFVFTITGGKPVLAGYHINSDALILN